MSEFDADGKILSQKTFMWTYNLEIPPNILNVAYQTIF
jgi:hypothetical protein